MPRVIKSDEVREPFNEDKLRRGMLKALEKRPVSSDDVETPLITSNLNCAPPANAKCRPNWWAIW